MKTFKQFLSEKSDAMSVADFKRQLEKDCAPYLAKHRNIALYRGINPQNDDMLKPLDVDDRSYNISSQDFLLGAVRNSRKPKDLRQSVHNGLNKIFTSRVGVPLRSASLFVAKDKVTAMVYGNVYRIFPIGEYHYAWSEYIRDPYYLFNEDDMTDELIDKLDVVKDEVQKKFKKAGAGVFYWSQQAILYGMSLIPDLWQYDTDLDRCPPGHEIMLVCDKYYAVNDSLQLQF